MKNNKKGIVVGLGILIILIIVVFLFLRNQRSDEIIFNDKYYLEYGEKINYTKLIEDSYPEDTKIIYPEVEFDRVGIYDLEFKLEGIDKKFKHELVVKDTKKPKITLRVNKDRQILVNSEYNVLSNIDKVSDIDDYDISKVVMNNETEYKKIKDQANKDAKAISQRKITNKTDLINEKSNFVIATTNLDTTKEGTYFVKVLAIDKNYNVSEKEWNVDVLAAGNIVNTGGEVTCDYVGNEIPTNIAFTISAKEIFHYDEDLEVTAVEVVMDVYLNDNYRMDSNIVMLIETLNESYSTLGNQGISSGYSRDGNNSVQYTVTIDIDTYDVSNDILGLFPEGVKSSIDINDIVQVADDQQVICDVK